jgi:hypothetical protein
VASTGLSVAEPALVPLLFSVTTPGGAGAPPGGTMNTDPGGGYVTVTPSYKMLAASTSTGMRATISGSGRAYSEDAARLTAALLLLVAGTTVGAAGDAPTG